MNAQKNKMIRKGLRAYLRRYKTADTRKVIALFANKYSTTPQQISGNLSWLKRSNAIVIVPNPPHSMMSLA